MEPAAILEFPADSDGGRERQLRKRFVHEGVTG
jgi:hypothetical protein